jgi:ATP-dependent protease HslVU (ClpYQ) peptidase subunit
MTTVIAFQGPNFAILGADCQITDGDRRILSPSTPKIVKVGRYLLAVRGDARPGDVLMYSWKPPTYDGSDPIKFMGKKIVPSIIKAFKANSYDFEKENAMFGFLIAFAGNVFEIGSDMSISQNIDGLYAIGSGSDYALGALSAAVPTLAKPEQASEQILQALAISAKYDINTSAPFQIEVQKL